MRDYLQISLCKRQARRRCIALILIVSLLIFSVLALAFTLTHTHHDCVGYSCHICLQLHYAEDALSQLGIAVFLLFAAQAGFLSFAPRLIKSIFIRNDSLTLVHAKIRLNN